MSAITHKTNTESYNADYFGVDQWPMARVIDTLLDDQARSLQAVRAAVPMLAAAADHAATRLEGSPLGRIVYAGAGTSIRIGVQDGTELTPTFGWPAMRIATIIAGGEDALNKAVENAEDDRSAAIDRVAHLKLNHDDVCIAAAASGGTPFTVAACRAARDAGTLTIGIASNPDSELLRVAEFPVFVNTGAEPVSGSTRMNAGTAQKAAINMLSTAIMTKMGRVHDGFMVNLIPTNEKLRRRAVFIVSTIARCDEATAAANLQHARAAYGGITDRNLKLAILLSRGISLRQALPLLDLHRGHLRPILSELGLD